jgi:hypothetical protein
MDDSREATQRHIAMVGFDRLRILDVTGPLEVFSRATSMAQYLVPRPGSSGDRATAS